MTSTRSPSRYYNLDTTIVMELLLDRIVISHDQHLQLATMHSVTSRGVALYGVRRKRYLDVAVHVNLVQLLS